MIVIISSQLHRYLFPVLLVGGIVAEDDLFTTFVPFIARFKITLSGQFIRTLPRFLVGLVGGHNWSMVSCSAAARTLSAQ